MCLLFIHWVCFSNESSDQFSWSEVSTAVVPFVPSIQLELLIIINQNVGDKFVSFYFFQLFDSPTTLRHSFVNRNGSKILNLKISRKWLSGGKLRCSAGGKFSLSLFAAQAVHSLSVVFCAQTGIIETIFTNRSFHNLYAIRIIHRMQVRE